MVKIKKVICILLVLTMLTVFISYGQENEDIIYADDIWLSYNDPVIYLYYNKADNFYQSLDIYYKVLPDDVTDKSVKITLKDPSIVNIDYGDDYFNITAFREGITDMCVESFDGKVIKNYKVKVEESFTRVRKFDILDDFIEVNIGETKEIKYDIYPYNATNKTIHWCYQEKNGDTCVDVEDDKSIVDVYKDINGRVYIKGVGKGVVNLVGTTEDRGFKDSIFVAVLDEDKGEPIKDIDIILPEKDIVVGDKFNLSYNITPLDGDISDLTWYSTEPGVLKVYPNGYAIAKSAGVSEIGVTSAKYDITRYTEVVVLGSNPVIYADNIVTPYNDLTLYKGQSMYLNYKVEPENVTTKGVRCVSINNDIVRVDDESLCKITAIKDGETSLDIISNDYRARSTIKVIVKDPSKDDNKKDDKDDNKKDDKDDNYIRDIYFLKSKETIEVDETKQLRVFSIPFRPTIDNLYFYSSDYDIVDVDDKGVIKGVSRGRAVVTVITADGLTDRVAVEVNEKEVLPKDLSIKVGDKYQDDKVDKIELNMGDSKYLQPVFQPADTTFTDIIWKTSDSKVVSINNNGLMKAVGPGEATITAQVRDTTLEVKLNVKVNYSESYWLNIDQGIADGDRDFIVIFSMNIRDSKSNKEKIYITKDPTGNNKDSLAVPVINDNEVVFKVPKQGWSRGEDYYIFIEEGVESVNGDLIKKGVRYKFKIRGAL